MKRNLITALIMGLFSLFFVVGSAKATTVIKKSFEQVAQEAELIFEGRVLSKETRLSPINDTPFTYFTLEIIDVVKGEYIEQTIELGFMGGPKGDLILKVSDMQMPEVGERGIYFLTTHSKQYIHPLSGWHQGHYLIISSEQKDMEVVVQVKHKKMSNSLFKSVRPPTVEDFKENIRNVIGREK